MISTWTAWSAVFALSTSEWVVIITAITGTGLVSQFVAATGAMRRLRREKQEIPTRERTVAAEEAEAAVRMLGVALDRANEDVSELRVRVETWENRWAAHYEVCPLLGGWRRGE